MKLVIADQTIKEAPAKHGDRIKVECFNAQSDEWRPLFGQK
jgi:hypothetical protein